MIWSVIGLSSVALLSCVHLCYKIKGWVTESLKTARIASSFQSQRLRIKGEHNEMHSHRKKKCEKSHNINVKDTNCDDSKYKVYFICTEIFICNIP